MNGQSLAEYGLVLALVVVVAIGGLNALGKSMQGVLAGLVSQMGGQSTNAPAVASAGGGTSATSPVSSPASASLPSPVNTAGGYCNGKSCGSGSGYK